MSSIQISDTRIVSNATDHTASKAPAWRQPGWEVTYLAGTSTLEQAVAAIKAAELFSDMFRDLVTLTVPRRDQHPHWTAFCAHADEMNMTPAQVWTELADTYPQALLDEMNEDA